MHSYKKKYKVKTRPTHTEGNSKWATLVDNLGIIKDSRASYVSAYEHIARLTREIHTAAIFPGGSSYRF